MPDDAYELARLRDQWETITREVTRFPDIELAGLPMAMDIGERLSMLGCRLAMYAAQIKGRREARQEATDATG